MSGKPDMLKGWVQNLAQLPPLSQQPGAEDMARNLTETLCACRKMVELHSLQIRDSGVIRYLDNVCDCCADKREMAAVICVRCKVVVMHLTPHTDKKGFVYGKGKVYHTEACPGCKPGITSAPVIEKILFDKNQELRKR